MIFDRVSEWKNYLGISKALDKALEVMATEDLSKYENGRHDVCDGVYFNLFEADTKPYVPGESKWEAHRDYLDVHVMLDGEEKIACRPLSEVTECDAYDPDVDAAFYTAEGDVDYSTAKVGSFLVCFPGDVHIPLIKVADPVHVRKAVLKVKIG